MHYPWEVNENLILKFLDPHWNVMRSILFRDPSSVHVWLKLVLSFFVILLTNRLTSQLTKGHRWQHNLFDKLFRFPNLLQSLIVFWDKWRRHLWYEAAVESACGTCCTRAKSELRGGVKAYRQMSQCCNVLGRTDEPFPSSQMGWLHLICHEPISTRTRIVTRLAPVLHGDELILFAICHILYTMSVKQKKKV